MRRYPSVFVNHGGGPMPLMGKQPELVNHMREVVSKWLPSEPPTSIVVVSAHWESNPIQITYSNKQMTMLYDYYGFPPECYKYKYPAKGNAELAKQIQQLLQQQHLPSQLNSDRGFDHGVFVPLMIMYPKADIPVVCVSLHSSLSPEIHWNLGLALSPLRDQGVLILGSGYTFHNMDSLFHPSKESVEASTNFNEWLKETLLTQKSPESEQDDAEQTRLSSSSSLSTFEQLKSKILSWSKAPGARISHPREEHLLPLFVTAAAGCRRDHNHHEQQQSLPPQGKNATAEIGRNGNLNNKNENDANHPDDTSKMIVFVPPKTTLLYDTSSSSSLANENNNNKSKSMDQNLMKHVVSGYMFE